MEKLKNDNPFYSKKVQDVLNKLISEEILASMTYRDAILDSIKVNPEDVSVTAIINKPFQTIADDELGDHYKALITFAMTNGYEIPTQEKEYKKYASEASWKGYDTIKKKQNALYYIDLMTELEKDAIKSYEAVLNDDNELPYELCSIVQKNYYDELEHLDDLHTLRIAVEANANLQWTNMYDGESPDCSYFWPYSNTYGACSI